MPKKYYPVLFLIILLGAFFRFSNLNWDQGFTYHPDERNIAAAVTRIKFPHDLDPKFHAYNGFSVYLIRLIGEAVAKITNNQDWLTDWGKINLIGRSISATTSTLSIPLLYL